MELRRFYTSPVNHHNLDEWPELVSRLAKAIQDVAPGVSVEQGKKPIFGYGGDAHAALEAERQLAVSPRHVRVDLWSSIVFYEVIGIAFGSRITEPEIAAISRRLETHELEQQDFLREVEEDYDIDSARVYGYAFYGEDDLRDIQFLLEPLDPAVYIGPRWMVLDENEEVDAAFEVIRDESGIVVFLVKDETATGLLWSGPFGSQSEGLIAIHAGDDAEDALVDWFSHFEDLKILVAEKPSAGMRVTMGRCHADDTLVVVYTPPHEPEIDQTLLFVI